jgi:ketosteroid isomerase-like protein
VSDATTSIEWIRDFAQQWLHAWNSHEVDRVSTLMTEDFDYRDDPWHKTMRGHADVRECIDSTRRATPT